MDARLVGRVIETARTVNPLLAVSAAALDLHQPPASGSVQAQVAARLTDGTFRVLVDGKSFKLSLPADVKPGDVLQLRVVGREAGTRSAANSAPSIAGTGVSTAGQLAAELVSRPRAAPARQHQPVLDVPPENPDALPEPLARAVERSGLFYESHQARWVNGEFPLERLMQEPQASAGKPDVPKSSPPAAPAEDTPSEPAARILAKTSTAAAVDGDPDRMDPKIAGAQDVRDAAPKAAEKSTEIAARETLNIVRQQLETLETRHIQWLGEIWPGQAMRWEIGDGQDDDGNARASAHEWNSRFALDLPGLGAIGAECVLSGNRLRIRVSAQDEATVATMRDAGPELVHALEAAGIDPLSFEVQHRAPDL